MLDNRDKMGRKSVIYLISQSQAGYNCKERGRVIWNMLSSANILKISVYCTALIISTRQTRHHCNSQIIVCTSLCSYVFFLFLTFILKMHPYGIFSNFSHLVTPLLSLSRDRSHVRTCSYCQHVTILGGDGWSGSLYKPGVDPRTVSILVFVQQQSQWGDPLDCFLHSVSILKIHTQNA